MRCISIDDLHLDVNLYSLGSSGIMDGGTGRRSTLADLDHSREIDKMVTAAAIEAGLFAPEQKSAKRLGGDPMSLPPSPPSSGATTPRLNTGPCPKRLWPYVPPPNYGTVDTDSIFRSSFPQDRNIDFVRSLGVRSVLTLVNTDPTPIYSQWLEEDKVKQLQVYIAPNKEGIVNTTLDSLCEALLFVMDGSNHPVYIHCNQGKHRTGCVVACLRKIQGMAMPEIMKEYVAYADKKARDGDIALIESFEPKVVFDYAKRHGYLDGSNRRCKRLDSTITSIEGLAAALSAGMAGDDRLCAGSAISSNSSDRSDTINRGTSSVLGLPYFTSSDGDTVMREAESVDDGRAVEDLLLDDSNNDIVPLSRESSVGFGRALDSTPPVPLSYEVAETATF